MMGEGCSPSQRRCLIVGAQTVCGSMTNLCSPCNKYTLYGRESWSSGYGKRLMFQRLWVQIPAPYTWWTFFTFFVLNILLFVWKAKNIQKEAGNCPFLNILCKKHKMQLTLIGVQCSLNNNERMTRRNFLLKMCS